MIKISFAFAGAVGISPEHLGLLQEQILGICSEAVFDIAPDAELIYLKASEFNYDSIPRRNKYKKSKNDNKYTGHSLLEMVWRDNGKLDHLTPREFERMIHELLERRNLNSQLTPQTHDGGNDIIVQYDILGNIEIFVECKKYARHRPVDAFTSPHILCHNQINRRFHC